MQLPSAVTRGKTQTGLAFLDIVHPKASARIFLQGAQVTGFQAAGQPPLLWLSEEEDFQPNKAIRGGIPICWPWFGAHPFIVDAPAHGFARTSLWQLGQVEADENGVTLKFTLTAEPRPDWPYKALLALQVVVSDCLRLTLATTNIGSNELVLTQALHSYFDILNIAQAQVTGLSGSRYDDQLLGVAGLGLETVQDELSFAEEIDRVYYPVHPIALHTSRYDLEIASTGSASAVIWNPWKDKSVRLSHFPSNGYQSMLCIETANCGRDTIAIAPGHSHTLGVQYRQLSTGKN